MSDLATGQIMLRPGNPLRALDAITRFFTLGMLFFSYFGVGASLFSAPVVGAVSMDRLCAIFALAAVIARISAGWRARNRLESLYFLYTAFVLAYGAISLGWSANPAYSVRQYANIVLQALLAVALLMQFGDGDDAKVDRVILLVFVVNMAIGFFEMATKHYIFQRSNEYVADYRLLKGFAPPLVGFYNTNDFCIAMVQILPIVVYRLKNVILGTFAILAVLVMTQLAYSDFAFFGALVYAGWFFISKAIRSRAGMAFAMLAFAGITLLLPPAVDTIMARTRIGKRATLAATDTSVIGRLALYGNALAISADHFGGGLGTGNSEHIVSAYSATHFDTLGKVNLHSLFLQLLVEYSWAGLFAFLAVLWAIFKATRALPPGGDPDLKTLCFGSLIMMPFIFSSSSNSITSAIGWITPALLILHLNRIHE